MAADPTAVPGLLYRMRPTGLGLSNGASVGSVPLLTGGLTLSQATGANQPVFLASGFGGQPALTFDGAADSLLSTTNLTARAQPVSIVCIYRPNDRVTDSNLLFFGSIEVLDQVDHTVMLYAGSGLASNTPVSNVNGGVVIAGANGATSTIYLNGNFVANFAAGAGGIDATPLGVSYHPSISSRTFSGDLYEFAVYDHILTATERAIIDTYAQDLYGIVSSDYVATVQNPDLPTPFRRVMPFRR